MSVTHDDFLDDEVAAVTAFLASDDASFITGLAVPVGGGAAGSASASSA